MHIKFLSLVALLSAVALKAAAAGDIDAQNGFRDVSFGTRIAAYPGMISTNRCISPCAAHEYVRLTDSLEFGSGQVRRISYRTLDHVVYGVVLSGRGHANAAAITRNLTHTYGGPDLRRPFLTGELSRWEGDVLSITIVPGFRESFTVSISNLSLSQEAYQVRNDIRRRTAGVH